MPTRQFILTEISFLGKTVVMDSILNSWGEDDPVAALARAGKFEENFSLGVWCYAAMKSSASDVLVDIGAFTGIYSLFAVAANRSMKVIALEPAPATFGRLLRNIQLNGIDASVVPANLAAGANSECSTFPHKYGIYALCPGDGLDAHGTSDHTHLVAVYRLDDLRGEAARKAHFLNSTLISGLADRRVAAIKIDVEGHELAVLNGANQILSADRPIIIAETLTATAVKALQHRLAQFSYVMHRAERERNMIFLPREKAAGFWAQFTAWRATQAARAKVSGRMILSVAQHVLK